MTCKCVLCMFERDGACTYKKPVIDELGRCETAFLIKINPEKVAKAKEPFFKESRYETHRKE